MHAVILAGGEGTRLRPLTLNVPKQLVPILNRPFIEHQLLYLSKFGVDRVTLALTRNAHSERLRQALGDEALGVRLTYAYEEQPLGSGGAIAGAAAGWDEPFLVCNGDIVTDVDLGGMYAAHRAAGAELTLFLHGVEDPSAYGVVALNERHEVTRFVEKPKPGEAPSNQINAGIWLFQPSLLREIPADRPNRVEDELFPQLASAGRRVLGYEARAYWRDIGTPRTYLEANLDALRGLVGGFPAAEGGVLRGPGAHIEAGAVVTDAVLGAGVHVSTGAQVESSVLWDRVRIGASAVVRNSVLAADVEIAPGSIIEGRTLGSGERA